MGKNRLILILFSILHFLVDGICGLIIFSRLYDGPYSQLVFVFFTYNTLAFVFQPIIGLIIDKYNHDKFFLLFSIFILLINLIFPVNFYLSTILCGLCNAIFHIVGGRFSLEKFSDSLSSQGLFVSLGAIGLALGSYLYSNALKYTFLVLCILVTSLIIWLNPEKESAIVFDKKLPKRETFLSLFFLCLVVLIRALVNKELNFTWNNTINSLIAISIVTALGKILGGVLSDLIGIRLTIILSSIISFLCLLFNNYLATNLIGILAFNFSMPITLYLINKSFPHHRGLSFGLLAMVLFPGYLLGMIEYPYILVLVQLFIGIIITCIVIILNERLLKNYGIIK